MTEKSIRLGNGPGGKPFLLPIDALIQTFAIVGIRGAGKTCGGTVMAEEFCKAGYPWIALDPTGVWWGLRANPDGSPGGYRSIVVIGGPHADIPLEKDGGEKLARALIEANVCAVIDLKQESKTMYRRFVTDFCNTLRQINSDVGHHIFIEEGPEFIPQKPKGNDMKAAHAAVDGLIRLGRNNGYGCTVLSQRAATVDKDVLSQCENVFAFRSTHNLDRKAFKEWLEGKVMDDKLWKKFPNELAGLKNGECFFWSPAWLERFERLRTRQRETFHPGETRKVGVRPNTVSLSDAAEFVERVRRQLAGRKMAAGAEHLALPDPPARSLKTVKTPRSEDGEEGLLPLDVPDPRETEIRTLKDQLAKERQGRAAAEKRLEAVRKMLKPQYDSLRTLFEELGTGTEGGAGDRAVYEPWLEKAGGGKRRAMLAVMVERGELTRSQLATLAAVSIRSSTYRNNLSWMKVNKLVEVEGDHIRLMAV